MDNARRMTIANGLERMTKPALADWLIAHGTVYPNRAGLLEWSKDDLVSSATDRVLDELDHNQVPA